MVSRRVVTSWRRSRRLTPATRARTRASFLRMSTMARWARDWALPTEPGPRCACCTTTWRPPHSTRSRTASGRTWCTSMDLPDSSHQACWSARMGAAFPRSSRCTTTACAVRRATSPGPAHRSASTSHAPVIDTTALFAFLASTARGCQCHRGSRAARGAGVATVRALRRPLPRAERVRRRAHARVRPAGRSPASHAKRHRTPGDVAPVRPASTSSPSVDSWASRAFDW